MNTQVKKLRVAVVGLGKMGLLHASLLNTLPEVQLAAFCEKNPFMRKLAKRTFKTTFVTDELQNLSIQNLDVVYVTTPIPSHYPILKTILSDGIASNIFVEKTLSSNYEDSKKLNYIFTQKSGVNMVGYMKRFSVTFKKAKELLDNQALGTLVSFDAYAYSSDFADVPKGSKLSGARGGVLEDLGSHVVDLALWFFKDLTITSASVKSFLAQGSPDSATFQTEAPDGNKGTFNISWVKSGYRMPEFGLTITGTKGTLAVCDTDVTLQLGTKPLKKWFRQDLNDNVGFLLGDPEYFREDSHFIDCIIHHSTSESSFESALKVDRLLDEVAQKAGV
ncbi:MAG: Gfo/Idh/MocA family oxidoreductase [Candidatus Bathyarchaeota archaeon]|nr:Gfo/Idh/MocA family oxidoreductase [Candidatus Bathyarchaeota archaeon]